MPLVATWMGLEAITLSEKSERQILYGIVYMWILQRAASEYSRKGTDTQTQRTIWCHCGERGGGGARQAHWGLFVSMKCFWAFLLIGSDIWLLLRTVYDHQMSFRYFANWFWHLTTTEDHLCWVWDFVPDTLRKGLWQICHLVCGCVFHLYDWYSCCLM